MLPLLLAARGLARAITAVWRDPETRALPVVAGLLVLTGTLFYWRFEDWTFIEALYFCVVTLTTVGYGDLSPTTTGTRIFTIVYILTGFGVLVALLTSVAQQYIALKAEKSGPRGRRRARKQRDQPAEEDRSGKDPRQSGNPRCPQERDLLDGMYPITAEHARFHPFGMTRERGRGHTLRLDTPRRTDGRRRARK